MICRSNEKTTAAASTGVPSWKTMLGRSSNVQTVPSVLTVQLVARSGSGSRRPGEKRTRRPYTCSATSSDSRSLARAGSRLTASVERATTRRSAGPPGTGVAALQAPRPARPASATSRTRALNAPPRRVRRRPSGSGSPPARRRRLAAQHDDVRPPRLDVARLDEAVAPRAGDDQIAARRRAVEPRGDRQLDGGG